MSSLTRREYWRQVRKRAWSLSKEHFAWSIPLVSGVVVSLLAWAIQGTQTAVEDYLKPQALGALAGILIAIGMYCINLFRAAAEIHGEQMTAIGNIDARANRDISELRQQIRDLTTPPNPLRMTFEPGQRPFEETHTVTIGVALGGLRTGLNLPVQQTTTRIRLLVENTSAADIQNVSVQLSFEPERRGQTKLPLQVMRQNRDPDGVGFQRSFTLVAFDHRYVEVLTFQSGDERAYILHTLEHVDSTLTVGTHDVLITVQGTGVNPQEARFRIEVTPDALRFTRRVDG